MILALLGKNLNLLFRQLVPIVILTFWVTANAFADAPVKEIQAVLVKPNIMCGKFEQTKKLADIKKPLLSSGRFCVLANKGILWRTLQPFSNTLRIKPDEITQLQGEQVITQLNAGQEPMVRMINGVLFSLLAGDLSQLNKLFSIEGSLQAKNWQVTLNAREPVLAKAIGTIKLEGDKYVRKVIMQEASGDQTIIIFSAMQEGPAAMNKEEEALFEH